MKLFGFNQRASIRVVPTSNVLICVHGGRRHRVAVERALTRMKSSTNILHKAFLRGTLRVFYCGFLEQVLRDPPTIMPSRTSQILPHFASRQLLDLRTAPRAIRDLVLVSQDGAGIMEPAREITIPSDLEPAQQELLDKLMTGEFPVCKQSLLQTERQCLCHILASSSVALVLAIAPPSHPSYHTNL